MNKEIKLIYDKIPSAQFFIPDKNLFRSTLFALNPNGIFNDSYDLLVQKIESFENKEISEGGRNVDYKYIFKKYDDYIEHWQANYGDRDPKYIKAKDALQNPLGWLSDNGFMKFYSVAKTKDSIYIFGGFSEDVLRKKLRIFNTLIGKENSNEHEEPKSEIEIKNAAGNSQGAIEEPF